jgi:hypothetical protein
VESRSMHFGSCLCGAVRFEVEGEFQRFYLCHCGHCRKDTGSAPHAANLFAPGGVGVLRVGSSLKQMPLSHSRRCRDRHL